MIVARSRILEGIETFDIADVFSIRDLRSVTIWKTLCEYYFVRIWNGN